MNKMIPSLSIIVPIYNTEDYLHRCIDSILSQTFEDYELILIDDGSYDTSGIICDYYMNLDSRIEVFHTSNNGVSQARNIGLKKSKGKYVTFIDSDDWIDNNYLACLMKNKADFVCEKYKVWNENNELIYISQEKNNNYYYESLTSSLIIDLLIKGVFNGIACKLYKNSIIKKFSINFDVSIDFGEDTLFNIQYIKYIKSLSINDNANYNYVVYHNNRATLSHTYSNEKILTAKKANYEICKNITFIDEKQKNDFYNKRMSYIYNDYLNYIRSLNLYSYYKALQILINDNTFNDCCKNDQINIIKLIKIIKDRNSKHLFFISFFDYEMNKIKNFIYKKTINLSIKNSK